MTSSNPRHLALALLAIELIAGMQTYLTTTVTPLVAAELDGQHLYGATRAVTQVAMFATMPLGAALLARHPAGTLLVRLTAVTVVGAAVSAAAPTMAVHLAGRALGGLAAGALVTVSLGAIVMGLPGRWRRLVLAGYAAVWVVVSLAGPAYAAWISELLSWRWAMVLYLPFLVLARIVVARQLARLDDGARADRDAMALRPALALGTGIALVSVLTAPEPWRVVAATAGIALTLAALARLLPAGAVRLRPGRPATVALFALLTGVYFGAESIVAIVAHDILAAPVPRLGALLTAGGLGWAVTGLACGRLRPRGERAYRRRVTAGTAAMTLGLAGCAAAGPAGSFALLVAGWTAAGVGMGLIYLDTLDRILASETTGGAAPAEATSAAALGEEVPRALLSTTAAAIVGAAAGMGTLGAGEAGEAAAGPGTSATPAATFAALAVLALAMLPAVRRATAC